MALTPIINGFRVRVDQHFKPDDEHDEFWINVIKDVEHPDNHKLWPSPKTPRHVLDDIRGYFELGNIYDMMREGNEAVFLKFERRARYSMVTSRPSYGVRELNGRYSCWTVELINKDLLLEGSAGKTTIDVGDITFPTISVRHD